MAYLVKEVKRTKKLTATLDVVKDVRDIPLNSEYYMVDPTKKNRYFRFQFDFIYRGKEEYMREIQSLCDKGLVHAKLPVKKTQLTLF